jgi:hypothetical protein
MKVVSVFVRFRAPTSAGVFVCLSDVIQHGIQFGDLVG